MFFFVLCIQRTRNSCHVFLFSIETIYIHLKPLQPNAMSFFLSFSQNALIYIYIHPFRNVVYTASCGLCTGHICTHMTKKMFGPEDACLWQWSAVYVYKNLIRYWECFSSGLWKASRLVMYGRYCRSAVSQYQKGMKKW